MFEVTFLNEKETTLLGENMFRQPGKSSRRPLANLIAAKLLKLKDKRKEVAIKELMKLINEGKLPDIKAKLEAVKLTAKDEKEIDKRKRPPSTKFMWTER